MSVKELSGDKLRKGRSGRFRSEKLTYGSAERPRTYSIQVQPSHVRPGDDDDAGTTFTKASTNREGPGRHNQNVEGGAKLGEEIGKRLLEKGVKTVVFDRNGYQYHGIVKAIATEPARPGSHSRAFRGNRQEQKRRLSAA